MMLNRWVPVVACTLLGSAAFGDITTITDVSGGLIQEFAPNDGGGQGLAFVLLSSGHYGWEIRPVLKFDMSAFPTADADSITGVTLRTYVPEKSTNSVAGGGEGAPLTFSVYAITSAWTPGDANSSYNSLKDSYNPAIPLGTAVQNFTDSVQTLDVTLNSAGIALIQSWITSPSTNYGLMIISTDGDNTQASFIGSSTYLPSLIIETTAVPEPAALSMLGLGLGALLLSRREKKA